jgi:hypothetical protein
MSRSRKTREPLWPKERDLSRYNVLAGFDIQKQLESGGLWIEVGIGKSAKPMRPLIGVPGVNLKAIAPHSRSLPKNIALTVGYVPDHLGFLAENRGRAKLVSDIFGAVSYCDDPVQALIYEALLLSSDGIYVGFTELYRLGDIESWDRITEFFGNRLHQEISFQTVFELGDASGLFSTYLRIRITGKTSRRASLKKILHEARCVVGVPQREDKPLWVSSDRSAKIWRMRYVPSE